MIRLLLWLAAWMLFGFALIESVKVFVAWWRNELVEPDLIDWFCIGLLPVLIGIYLRFFSVFRPDCQACVLPADKERER
jgi:hypothetical protein